MNKNDHPRLILIISVGSLLILLAGLAFDVYFGFRALPSPQVLSQSLKTINPSLEGEVLGQIKKSTQGSAFVPPEKLPF